MSPILTSPTCSVTTAIGTNHYPLMLNLTKCSVVVALAVERSLLLSLFYGSNPVIGNFLQTVDYSIYFLPRQKISRRAFIDERCIRPLTQSTTETFSHPHLHQCDQIKIANVNKSCPKMNSLEK